MAAATDAEQGQSARRASPPARIRPPMEAVLSPFLYAVLLVEVVALIVIEVRTGTSPSKPLGMWLGYTGTLSMVLMHVYSIRRRVRSLSRLGRLSRWLQLHIFLGFQGALFVTFHSMHLSTLRNLSGGTFALTLVVVMSGIFGRYLFAMLPKGMAGERLSAREVEAELAELLPLIEAGQEGPAAEAGSSSGAAALRAALAELARPVTTTGHEMTFSSLVTQDRQARRALRALDAAIALARRDGLDVGTREVLDRTADAARRRAMLRRRLATLASAERLFRGWTVLHRPLTFLLFGTVALHIIGHYLFSAAYTT